MIAKRDAAALQGSTKWYQGADIPMAAIRRYARQIGDSFKPEKIVLFGSYAYGTPNEHSDVDLLVVMPCRNTLSKAVQMEIKCPPPFPVDIIVRTPASLKWRLADGDSFHTEILSKGKTLYEKDDSRVGEQGRRRSIRRTVARRAKQK